MATEKDDSIIPGSTNYRFHQGPLPPIAFFHYATQPSFFTAYKKVLRDFVSMGPVFLAAVTLAAALLFVGVGSVLLVQKLLGY